MVLPLAFFSMLLTIQSQNVCIWDKKSTEGQSYQNNMLNGQFLYDGLYNSNPSWIKTQHANCGPSPLYLYQHEHNFWAIANSKESSSYYARCAEPNVTLCSSGKWLLKSTATDTWWPDDTMCILSGNCPHWDCGTITTNAVDTQCTSFTKQIGANAWKGSNEFIWHFSTVSFCWLCVDSASYEYDDCDAVYQLKTSLVPWQNISSGDSTSLTIEYTTEEQQTLTVMCNGKGTTTQQPTPFIPTLNPVINPTSHPTVTVVVSSVSPTKGSNGNDHKGDDDEEKGFDVSNLTNIETWTWWMYVAGASIVLCFCIVIILCIVKIKKKKGYAETGGDEFGDTVQMNKAQPVDANNPQNVAPFSNIVIPTSVYNPYGAPPPDVYRNNAQGGQQNMYNQNQWQ